MKPQPHPIPGMDAALEALKLSGFSAVIVAVQGDPKSGECMVALSGTVPPPLLVETLRAAVRSAKALERDWGRRH